MNLNARSCVVCGGSSSIEKYDQPMESITGIGNIDYHHKIHICNDCGFVFVNPILDDETILAYYRSFSTYEHPENDGNRPAVEINQIHRYFELLKARFPGGFKGNVADIGCATAYGLSLFKKEGWAVQGFDSSSRCIEISKELYDVDVEECFFDIERIKQFGKFDLFIFCHVFEHLLNPNEVANLLHDAMNEDGLVYIEVPNLQKPEAPKCYFSFEHVNYFTPTSLENLMNQSGFEVDSMNRFDNGPKISPYYPVIASTWKKSDKIAELKNNFEEAVVILDKFKNTASELIKKIQSTIDHVLAKTSPDRIALWGGGCIPVSY
jgi:SAM-dependent methyltransferase